MRLPVRGSMWAMRKSSGCISGLLPLPIKQWAMGTSSRQRRHSNKTAQRRISMSLVEYGQTMWKQNKFSSSLPHTTIKWSSIYQTSIYVHPSVMGKRWYFRTLFFVCFFPSLARIKVKFSRVCLSLIFFSLFYFSTGWIYNSSFFKSI